MLTYPIIDDIERRFFRLWNLIGNTPMLELHYDIDGEPGKIYVKCEYYSLTGSIKDRMALYILYKAYRLGNIRKDYRIVEATSGNTGIAFAAIGRALGHQVEIIMPNWLSQERIDIIRSLGAEVQLVSHEQGGFLESIRLCERMAATDKVFLPRQFENVYNIEAHERSTGKEIWLQLACKSITPDAFVSGVGTGGTVMGVGRYLRKMKPDVQVFPLEPAESPTLTTGHKVGSHRIQGISDEFIPAIVNLNELDEVIQVRDGDAILMAQKLSRQLGLAVGISSGANVVGAIRCQQRLGPKAVVATVLCDSNKKYLSTDLMKEEPIKEGYLSPSISFKDYQAIGRLDMTFADLSL